MRLLRPLERIGPDDIAVALMGALRAAYRFFGFARSALAMRPPEPQAMRQQPLVGIVKGDASFVTRGLNSKHAHKGSSGVKQDGWQYIC